MEDGEYEEGDEHKEGDNLCKREGMILEYFLNIFMQKWKNWSCLDTTSYTQEAQEGDAACAQPVEPGVSFWILKCQKYTEINYILV